MDHFLFVFVFAILSCLCLASLWSPAGNWRYAQLSSEGKTVVNYDQEIPELQTAALLTDT